MPPRAYWKGHLRLSLVSFPVQLIPATDTRERITFHKLHRPSGQRVRYQQVVPDLGPVESEDIAKGYEYEKGRYVVVEPDEIDRLKLESTHTLDIVQFVDAHEIDAIYYDRPYFVIPDGSFAEDAFRVVRDALRTTSKRALGQIVLSARERLASLQPCGRGMVLETLRYDDEVRDAGRYFADIREGSAEGEPLALAKQLIAMKSAPFEPERFKDRYQEALRELVEGKLHGDDTKVTAPPAGSPKVIDLMEALKRSLSGRDAGERAPPAANEDAAAAEPAEDKRSGGRRRGAAAKPARSPRRKADGNGGSTPRRKTSA